MDTGTGHEGIKWDTTLHNTKHTEYLDFKEQVLNTERMIETKSTRAGIRGKRSGDGQSTNINNPVVTRMNISGSTTIRDKDESKEPVVKDNNNNKDKVWPLLENRYGIDSMSLPRAKETEETSGCMYLLNETLEQLNMNLQETDLDGRLGKHTTCTIL